VSAGPDVVARERDPLDPTTLESVGRVAITQREKLFGFDQFVVEKDNDEMSRLDLGMSQADDPARKVPR